MIENLITLVLLILLQAVLGFDNLLYISLESRQAPADQQKRVRTIGISLAIALRIILLFVLVNVMKYFEDPFYELNWEGVVSTSVSIHSLIILFGGGFIVYTAIKEIFHMISLDNEEHQEELKPKSINKIITMIVIMNLVFSFDSILSAMALSDVFWVMAAAIVISGVLMIWLSGHVSEFLKKNRLYEVLGLFVLFVVGIMLLTEGGEKAEIILFNNPIEAMSKTTFYFVISVLVITDIVQSRYQKKLMKNN